MKALLIPYILRSRIHKIKFSLKTKKWIEKDLKMFATNTISAIYSLVEHNKIKEIN